MYKRILIADDHFAVRSGIKYILSEEFPKIEFGEVINVPEVFKLLKQPGWDALIMNVDLTGRTGLEILKANVLANQCRTLPINKSHNPSGCCS
jgi:DNA-binding NarL/FixJ family response regulator